MSGTELKTDSSHRWMIYTKDAYGSGNYFFTAEQKQAVEEGKRYAERAYSDVWAKEAELVKRVRSFLATHFHWHDWLANNGTGLDVIQTLQSMIRGGSVVLITAPSTTSGWSSSQEPRPERLPTFRESLMKSYGMSYDAATAYIDRYNDMVERINARSGSLAHDAGSLLTGATDDLAQTATALGDAQTFVYSPQPIFGETEELTSAGSRDDMYACDISCASL